MNGKQLKNSILQWAIQGKLVPQDPNDEPASVLLERIREEKKRLIKEGKIKKDKNESIIFKGDDNSYYEKFADGKVVCIDEEIPFEIPVGWEWCRLGMAVVMNPRNMASDDIDAGFIPMSYIDSDLSNTYKFDVKKWKTVKSGFTHLADGDVAFAKITPCITNLKAAVMHGLPNGIAAGTTELNVFRSVGETIIAEYLLYYLATPYVLADAVYKGTAGQQRIMTQYLSSRLLPIPPYVEQKKIVDTVQSLLPIIHKYSRANKALEALNDSIYILLRKSVLQEAIQGKLVVQDPNDEPASILLEKIAKEKQHLVTKGILKAKDAVSSVIFRGEDNKYYEKIGSKTLDISEEVPFDIPKSWAWSRLGNLFYNATGLAYSKDSLDIKSAKPIRVLRGGNILEGKWEIKTDDVFIAPEFVNEKLILRKGTFITPAVTSLERMGKTALIREDLDDTVVGGFVLMLLPFMIDNALLEYMLLFFQTIYYKQYCISITNKSGQAFYNISRTKLMQCLVPVPPHHELERIVGFYNKTTVGIAVM